MRLSYFRDTTKWGDQMERGQAILEYLYETYKLNMEDANNGAFDDEIKGTNHPASPPLQKGWIDSLLDDFPAADEPALCEELSDYFSGKYRYHGGDILLWWKVSTCLPIFQL